MTPKFLVIEDRSYVAHAIVRHLVWRGARASVAASLADAKREILSAEWDAVLIDYHLPDGKGTDLLELLGERMPEARVQIMSADPAVLDEVARIDESLALNKDGHVAGLDRLVREVQERLAARNDGPPTGARVLTNSARVQSFAAENDLTEQEIEVVRLAAEVLARGPSARRLGISVKTLEKHRTSIFEKVGVENMAELLDLLRREAG